MRKNRLMHIVALTLAAAAVGACEMAPTAPAGFEVDPALASSHAPLETPTALYEVTSLGTLPGFTTRGTSINDAGDVAGQLNPDPPPGDGLHAFLWTPEDGVVDIGPTTGSNFIGYSINNATVVTGYRLLGLDRVAFRWAMDSGFEDLGALGGHTWSRGTAINDAGQVAGVSSSDTETRAVLWDVAGAIQSLGTLGGDTSRAFGINEAGAVVGVSTDAAGDPDAFMWTETDGMTALDLFEPGIISRPLDVNENGDIVGIRFLYDADGLLEARHGFHWTEADGVVDLHELGGFTGSSIWSSVGGINDAGQVAFKVQDGTDLTDPMRSYVWSAEWGFVPLPPLEEGASASAWDINDAGQVVGASEEAGIEVAVVWTPLEVGDVLDRTADIVDDLVADGVLRSAHARGLRAKLDRIHDKIEDGRTGAAIRQLEAFINQVEALVGAGKLTEAEGARLIEAARTLIAALR